MKIKLLLLLPLSILLACTKDVVPDVIEPEEKEEIVVDVFGNKSNPSVSNPELIDNWENLKSVTLNSGSVVIPPWRNGSESAIPYDMSTDIKKADGWNLLFHSLQKVGLNDGQNYMMFYNEQKGVMKIFYCHEWFPPRGLIWCALEYNLSTGANLFACMNGIVQNIADFDDQMFVNKDNPSVSNPDLIDNWGNLSSITLNSGYDVTLPWQSGTSSAIPFEMATDIKKEDGWKILTHTFKDVGLMEFGTEKDYMVFYNESIKELKVFHFASYVVGAGWFVVGQYDLSTGDVFDNGEVTSKLIADLEFIFITN
jgi:hypothetical protein